MDRILVVSKQTQLKTIIQTEADRKNFAVEFLPNMDRLLNRLHDRVVALLLIDLALISDDALQSGTLYAVSPSSAVILLATPEQRDLAVRQLYAGAADYLLLPVSSLELGLTIERHLKTQRSKQEPKSTFSGKSGINELYMLNRITQEIIQSLHPDDSLEIILARAQLITDVDLTIIWLADQEGRLHKHQSLTKTTLSGPLRRESDLLFDLAQQAVHRQQIILKEKSLEPNWQGQTLQSALLLPLMSKEKLLGILALGSAHENSFSNTQIEWLSVFCKQAAIALENARLFHALSSAYLDLEDSREQILRDHNMFQALFDGITDGLYALDKDLTINSLNRVEAERLGVRADELVGKSFTALEGVKAAPQLISQINEALKTGHETIWSSPEEAQGGFLRDREFRIYPIRNQATHKNEQLVIFAQDVSERRRLQASLFRSANLAAVGQLAGSVAHQINNPLTVTMTNGQLLLEETDPLSEAHELAGDILKAGKRIRNIIENLLEFSNQEKYVFVETSLVDSIEGALALVKRSLDKAKIKIVKDYEIQPRLSASVSHLKLVWINLLLNARDAVADYAPQPRIQIATRSISEKSVKVTITDNGMGLKRKEMEQIFRPFYTTKHPGKALGLGLYAAHAIVERHGGQINVMSEHDGETTFEIVLPLDHPRDL